MTGPLAERHEREMMEYVQHSLSEFIDEARASGHELSVASGIGDPEAVVTEFAERNAVDLMVVGTHGRTGIRRAVLGSVAERLIRLLPCDVLAVPSPQ